MGTAELRRPDWSQRLAETVERARLRVFCWGTHDCALFVADCALAMTGNDPGAPYRGRYRTARGAMAALKRVAGGNVDAAADLAFGQRLPSTMLAQRGDACLVDSPAGPALGICIGIKIALAGPTGLAFMPLAAARAAWRV